ncbi:hypothetical protein JCM13580A_24790 [Streptomyces drozdowiczii]
MSEGPGGRAAAVLDGHGGAPGGPGRLLGKAGVGLAGPGQRGLLGSTASVNLEGGGTDGTRRMRGERRDEWGSTLAIRGNGRAKDARISPGRESFLMPGERICEENARLPPYIWPVFS